MVNAGALVTTDLVRGKDPAEKFERIWARSEPTPETRVSGWTRTPSRPRCARQLESRHRLPHAQPGHDLGGRRVDPRPLPAAVLGAGHLPGSRGNGSDAGERRREPPNRRAGAPPPPRKRSVECAAHLRHVRRRRSVGLRHRRPRQERRERRHTRIVPGKGGIGVYSPGLDAHGNSVRGIRVCQEISERLGYTSLPPKPKMPCSSLRSLVKTRLKRFAEVLTSANRAISGWPSAISKKS